jgi:hypothetical protein
MDQINELVDCFPIAILLHANTTRTVERFSGDFWEIRLFVVVFISSVFSKNIMIKKTTFNKKNPHFL